MPVTLDFFVNFNYQSSTIILLVINILCVTYVTSLTMPDPQNSDMRPTKWPKKVSHYH